MESRSSLLPPEPLAQRISRLFAWAAGACILFGCGLLVSLDVITRAIFRRGVIESFEISGYAFAAAVYDALYANNPAFTSADVKALVAGRPDLADFGGHRRI